MFKRIKEIIELIKLLYVKVSIMCCCRSDCQIGRDEKGYKIPKTISQSGDDNHVDEVSRVAHTSVI